MTVGEKTLAAETSPFTEEDRLLIEELRTRVVEELKLVPCYDHDFSIFRWIVGYDKNLDEAEKAMKRSLIEIGSLKLHKHDFSTIDKIHEFCDNISAPLKYFPGSLIGYDKAGNVISLQPFGGFDALGLYESLKISDLYLMRIAESEGVMQLLRERENKYNRQLGTTVIIDLDGCSMDMLYAKPLKIMGQLLAKLQKDTWKRLARINSEKKMWIPSSNTRYFEGASRDTVAKGQKPITVKFQPKPPFSLYGRVSGTEITVPRSHLSGMQLMATPRVTARHRRSMECGIPSCFRALKNEQMKTESPPGYSEISLIFGHKARDKKGLGCVTFWQAG
uniref:CRAL-TRIO domain-containing protein n=1 Tax=Steinernema glaseri TaxID=37863 RepID=A0A1I7YFZ6_9BILA